MNVEYKYLEIINRTTKEVIKRVDVTNQPERLIERTEYGININLNHAEYYTDEVVYNEKQELI